MLSVRTNSRMPPESTTVVGLTGESTGVALAVELTVVVEPTVVDSTVVDSTVGRRVDGG
jgi:hypothetical protein